MDDAELRQALAEAQAAVIEAPRRRRELVMLALKQGWTKYKIGQALNAKGPTVDAIIDTAEREAARESQ